MKISRDGSIFYVLVFFVALLSNSLGILFKGFFFVLVIGMGLLIVLELIKNLCKPKTSQAISKVQDKISGVETLTLSNFNPKALNEVTAVWKAIPEVGSVKDKELLFAHQIRAIDRSVKILPSSMCSIIAQKAMYEIKQKKASLDFHKLGPKPFATSNEILRPLEDKEVTDFKTFCEGC